MGTANYIKFIASVLLFGSNGIVAAAIHAPALTIVFWRTLLGSLLLIVIFIGVRGKLTILSSKKDAIFMLVSGVSTGLSWVFLYEAYQLIGVGISTIIYYVGPVLVMAISPLVFKEKLTTRKLACLFVVLVGALLVEDVSADEGANAAGLTCAALSAVCHALMVIFNKLASRTQGLENPMLQLIISFLTIAGVSLFVGGSLPDFPTSSLFPLVFLGLVNTGLGCYWYFSSLAGLRAQTVVVLGYLEPLSAVVLALVVLGEPMSGMQALGSALIIGGALTAEVVPKKTLVG